MEDDYEVYKAEAEACGYEVASREEFEGLSCPKDEAMERYMAIDPRDIDLY